MVFAECLHFSRPHSIGRTHMNKGLLKEDTKCSSTVLGAHAGCGTVGESTTDFTQVLKEVRESSGRETCTGSKP